MIKIFSFLCLLAFLTISITSCTQSSSQENLQDEVSANNNLDSKTSVPSPETNTSDSDLAVFWKDFKVAALNNDHEKVEEMTVFPFFAQNGTMSTSEFEDFTFPDYILPALKEATLPVKSTFWIEGYKEGSLYEVEVDGPFLYFTKSEKGWRFAGIMYGE